MRVHPLKLFLIINALASLAAFTSENPGTCTIVAPLFAAAALACVGCLERQRQGRQATLWRQTSSRITTCCHVQQRPHLPATKRTRAH